ASGELLDIDLDAAAAGKSDAPGGLVRDAKLEHSWRAVGNYVRRLFHDRALDASAGHGAKKIPLSVDDEMRADRAGSRTPRLNHGRNGHVSSGFPPGFRGGENVFVSGQHSNTSLVNFPTRLDP